MGNPLSAASLQLTLDKKLLAFFTPLLQEGFRVRIQAGGSLAALLGEQLGLKAEYVKERIRTIFLDGKPVDDLGKALIRDGSILALSAAMPGLAGATLRSGGFFAGLRSQITYQDVRIPIPESEGFIIVKLFNLLISELGPIFLRRGIYLPREDFAAFLKTLPEDFWKDCRRAKVKGIETEVGKLPALNGLDSGWILFSVHFSP